MISNRIFRFYLFTNFKKHRHSVLMSRNLCSGGSNKTHFGFETVSEEEKSQRVYKVFENVATNYDLMNDAMSLGVHRFWKDSFVEMLAPSASTRLIDVAGGTGDIAFRFLKHVKYASDRVVTEKNTEISHTVADNSSQAILAHVTVVDINEPMLNVGRERCRNEIGAEKYMSWVQGDAEALPVSDNNFDAYTIAFGIRNCTHVDQVVKEAYRVLKPGGRFLCLEFSQITNPVLSKLYDAYSFNVIPTLGYLIAKDWKSYQYLVESIRQFPDQEEFAEVIREAGFSHVTYTNMSFGVVAVHSGFKL